jgi:hypothetical protein
MPTGYTSDIYENKNVSFESFALQCARAFGSCISQRDDPMTVKPKLQEPDIEYGVKKIAELEKFKKPTKAEFKKHILESISDLEADAKKSNDIALRYEQMLYKARAWVPPSKEHENLKQFMIDQLVSSIQFDCHASYYQEQIKSLKEMTYEDYVSNVMHSNKEAIKACVESIKKAKDSTAKNNEWITLLFNSLKENEKP